MSVDPALREERDFLLGSLDDLEAEYAAGDLDDADYESLKADYTTRAARVLRAIEAGEQPAPIKAPTAKRTGWMWLAGIAVVATLAGILVAQFSGSRTLNDTITGDIRVTTRELLLEAQQLLGEGDLDAAIDVYDDVLELSPANTEALAYKAWFLRLQGNVDAARPLVEDAVAIDPEYADARVFATAIALDVGDVDAAKGHLDAFDQLDAPPFIEQLVVQQGLRDRLADIAQNDALARVEPVALVDDPVPFSETGLTVDDVLLAAEALAAQGEPFTGIQLGEWMLESVPENPDALAGQGWLLARSATSDALAPAEIGLTFLDRALGVESAHPEALVYRAFVHNFLGDPVSAAADLAAFDGLETRPADLRGLILAFGLRESIGAS
ncbi:MAG: tetratricopeptide repeat protein [Actinomycetota bacterium]|nr:tetratricopeptide repeat protein [Actinomycetota bacterium]